MSCVVKLCGKVVLLITTCQKFDYVTKFITTSQLYLDENESISKMTSKIEMKFYCMVQVITQNFIEPFVKLQFMPFNEVWLSTTHAIVLRVSHKIRVVDGLSR